MSLEDLEDITHTRVMLECEALRQSIALGDDDWEGALLAAFHRLSKAEEKLTDATAREEWEERNRIFHEVLISACPSRWIKHFLAILYHQAERYRRLRFTCSRFRVTFMPSTKHYSKPPLARDTEKACAVMAEHILLTFRSIQIIPPEQLNEKRPD